MLTSRLTPQPKNRLHEPHGLAFRTDDPRDARTWARGYIWVAPTVLLTGKTYPWRLAPLAGLLAHEVGHIFGIPHIPGTLMADSYVKGLAELAYNKGVPDSDLLEAYLQMDGESELFLCGSSRCALQNYHGHLQEEAFSKLTGRRAVGETAARFYIRRLPASDERNLPNKFVQWAGSISDELGDYRLFLEVDNRPLQVKTGLELFHNIFSAAPLSFEAQSYQARLHSLSGERIPVQILRNQLLPNGGSNRFIIDDWDGNTFFSAYTHQTHLEARWRPKPDLQIVRMAAEDPEMLSVEIKNSGLSHAWATNLTVKRENHWIGTAWVPALMAGKSVTVLLPLTGRDQLAQPGDLSVSELGLGSPQLELHWRQETVRLFRDQLYLPTIPTPTAGATLVVEIDTWNSVLESDEGNNQVSFTMP